MNCSAISIVMIRGRVIIYSKSYFSFFFNFNFKPIVVGIIPKNITILVGNGKVTTTTSLSTWIWILSLLPLYKFDRFTFTFQLIVLLVFSGWGSQCLPVGNDCDF